MAGEDIHGSRRRRQIYANKNGLDSRRRLDVRENRQEHCDGGVSSRLSSPAYHCQSRNRYLAAWCFVEIRFKTGPAAGPTNVMLLLLLQMQMQMSANNSAPASVIIRSNIIASSTH